MNVVIILKKNLVTFWGYTNVPEVLNVHVSESYRKIYFSAGFFPLTFEKENVIFVNTVLNLNLFYLIVVYFLWISFIWTFRTSGTCYTDNSNKGLIYPYTFLYIIIILTYRKIYFNLYTIGKKNYY